MAQNLYITIAELKEAYDARLLGDLADDTGSRDALGDETNTIVLNAIERASARVERHCLKGGRYTEDDLSSLQTDDDWGLKGLVATLAAVDLIRRRGGGVPESLQGDLDEAQGILDDLASGAMVFRHDESIDAGAPKVHVMSSSKRGQLGLISDSAFFPQGRTTTV